MRKWIVFGLFLSFVIVLAACNTNNGDEQGYQEEEATETTSMEDVRSENGEDSYKIEVDLINPKGNITGKATLTEEKKGVNIHIEAWDLTEGAHGFHFHEKALCEPPTFESAGGHFNPTNAKHGFENPEGPHAGDLPNLEVGEDGTVDENIVTDLVTLKKGEKNSLIREGGTSLMIHADPDDYKSQPAGNSGDRIACGVVRE